MAQRKSGSVSEANTIKERLLALESQLATAIAKAESLYDMYDEAYNCRDFIYEVHEINEQLMNLTSELPDK